jgi:hypothetical protein
MFFDKSYIELICSPDILVDEHDGMTTEEAISWIEERGLRYELEERAAILEYEGGLDREAADKQALREIVKRLEHTVSGGNQHD